MGETKKPSTTTSSSSFCTSVTDFLLGQIGIRFHTPHWETLSPHHHHTTPQALPTPAHRLSFIPNSSPPQAFRTCPHYLHLSFHLSHCSIALRTPCHLLRQVLPVPVSISPITLLHHRLGLSERAHPPHVYSCHSLSRALTTFFPLSANLSPIYLIYLFAFSYCFPQEPCGMVEGREGVCLVQGFTVELSNGWYPRI